MQTLSTIFSTTLYAMQLDFFSDSQRGVCESGLGRVFLRGTTFTFKSCSTFLVALRLWNDDLLPRQTSFEFGAFEIALLLGLVFLVLLNIKVKTYEY